ncbi:hypothetical protein A3N65_12460 [Klebsiella aerogenes]|nr:hypothetical protein A3N65_12460 [Klebsiella aerogenes]
MGIFIQLLNGWRIIVTNVSLFFLFAIVYLFSAKETWTSTAIITKPDEAQIASWYNVEKTIFPESALTIVQLQDKAAALFADEISASAYLLKNKAGAETLVITPVNKGSAFPVEISCTGHSALETQKNLSLHIKNASSIVVRKINSDLKGNIKKQIATILSFIDASTEIAKEKKSIKIAQMQEALKYAELSLRWRLAAMLYKRHCFF